MKTSGTQHTLVKSKFKLALGQLARFRQILVHEAMLGATIKSAAPILLVNSLRERKCNRARCDQRMARHCDVMGALDSPLNLRARATPGKADTLAVLEVAESCYGGSQIANRER